MRAAFITEPGPPEAIQVGQLPVPVPGPTDVLVAVEVSAVNPADTFIRSGRYPTPMPLPFVGGPEVDTVGELARSWFKQRGMHRAIIPLWLPGKTASSLRQRGNTCPQQATGTLSWETWLQHPSKSHVRIRNVIEADG
jgi:D-arabinose 1-dehydrogenase-like Zn-dependent alcohol dehydrogenase